MTTRNRKWLPKLVLREPFHQKGLSRHRTGPGKYYVDESGKRVSLLDTHFVFKSPKVKVDNDRARSFNDIVTKLRSSKYTSYAHCKLCFLDNSTGSNRKLHQEEDSCRCIRCGLPKVRFVLLEEDERFCVVCSLMNKYQYVITRLTFFFHSRVNSPRPHIRCMIHPSGTKSRQLGSMYVLLKGSFSISSASKQKKMTAKSQRLEKLLTEEIWKLNSAIRFEYLHMVRNIISEDLSKPEAIELLRETREEAIGKIEDIADGEDMDDSFWKEHDLDMDLSDVSRKYRRMFLEQLEKLMEELVECLNQQIHYVKNIHKKVGKKSNAALVTRPSSTTKPGVNPYSKYPTYPSPILEKQYNPMERVHQPYLPSYRPVNHFNPIDGYQFDRRGAPPLPVLPPPHVHVHHRMDQPCRYHPHMNRMMYQPMMPQTMNPNASMPPQNQMQGYMQQLFYHQSMRPVPMPREKFVLAPIRETATANLESLLQPPTIQNMEIMENNIPLRKRGFPKLPSIGTIFQKEDEDSDDMHGDSPPIGVHQDFQVADVGVKRKFDTNEVLLSDAIMFENKRRKTE